MDFFLLFSCTDYSCAKNSNSTYWKQTFSRLKEVTNNAVRECIVISYQKTQKTTLLKIHFKKLQKTNTIISFRKSLETTDNFQKNLLGDGGRDERDHLVPNLRQICASSDITTMIRTSFILGKGFLKKPFWRSSPTSELKQLNIQYPQVMYERHRFKVLLIFLYINLRKGLVSQPLQSCAEC